MADRVRSALTKTVFDFRRSIFLTDSENKNAVFSIPRDESFNDSGGEFDDAVPGDITTTDSPGSSKK